MSRSIEEIRSKIKLTDEERELLQEMKERIEFIETQIKLYQLLFYEKELSDNNLSVDRTDIKNITYSSNHT